ncbi:yellow laccase [Mycena alexandri]|uniref:Yellow laccase n=1 Tax=Mycena alexandri TaxID=1745969 RepID=A0AAD6RZE0_9AGAR|nr:yellow laccase [Mycena alexandri]
MNFAAYLALSLLSGSSAAAVSANVGSGSVKTLQIVNKNINLDGFSRSAVLAGGTFPGTPILANKGDRMSINVVDSLTDPTVLRSTSIHWHGVFQDGTSWADGTAFVTQCPIAANDSFLYDFTPTGQVTFWYHSHLSTQYCDGLRGPLIIYDPNDPQKHLYDIDDASTIISLADWFHVPALNAPIPFLYTTNTINGKGRFAGGPASPLSVISVIPGLRYRFRLISMSCEPNFIFSIDGHTMTVIEADGVLTQPLVVDSIQIYAGQRYSFVLTANQKISNYWVRSVPNFGDNSFTGGVNSAILRYISAPNTDPTTKNTASTKPLLETNLHPLVPVAVPGLPHPGGADVLINLNIGLDLTTVRYTLNGVSFIPPSAPALLQILSGTQLAQSLLPSGSYYSLPPNKVIEVSIPGGTDPAAPHPFHLHGHNFFVVKSAGSDQFNFKNPVVRDVINTGRDAYPSHSRFVTDNAGPWFLHCHIDFHLDIGLAVVFAEDVKTVSKEVTPSAWKNLCPRYNGLKPNQL